MTGISLISNGKTPASANGTTGAGPLTGSAQTLNQNDFLQLLVKQIQFQDPLNPKSNTEMAAQMAQFTSLQQASQMSASLSMLQASSLIGNTVTMQPDLNDTKTITGVVSGVTLTNGAPQIMVTGADGTVVGYSLNHLVAVMPTASGKTGTR